MKSAIQILQLAIQNAKNNAVQLQHELDEAKGIVRSKEKLLAEAVKNVEEMEDALDCVKGIVAIRNEVPNKKGKK